MGGFCLLVEFQWIGSATNKATRFRILYPNTNSTTLIDGEVNGEARSGCLHATSLTPHRRPQSPMQSGMSLYGRGVLGRGGAFVTFNLLTSALLLPALRAARREACPNMGPRHGRQGKASRQLSSSSCWAWQAKFCISNPQRQLASFKRWNNWNGCLIATLEKMQNFLNRFFELPWLIHNTTAGF